MLCVIGSLVANETQPEHPSEPYPSEIHVEVASSAETCPFAEISPIEESSSFDADQLGLSEQSSVNDIFLSGYLQGLIDVNFYEYRVKVFVRNGDVFIHNLPCNKLMSESIVTMIEDQPCVRSVQPVDDHDDCVDDCCECCQRIEGVWFPHNMLLFAPLIADPREPCYSGAFRFDDNAMGGNWIGAVSFGDIFPIYRWRNVWPWGGDMQIDLEACVFAVFDVGGESAPLMNADYFVAIPLSYAWHSWSFRLRLAHVSSHLGDEFICEHPDVLRLNPSRETLDFFASYQVSSALRLYGGIGTTLHYDRSFTREGMYAEYGAEVRLLGCRYCSLNLYGTPFFAMHIRHWNDLSDNGTDTNRTYALGYEWSKLSGIGRKFRMYVEYHEGFSLEGQLSRLHTHYLAAKIAYGF